jgi:hypothetical protein
MRIAARIGIALALAAFAPAASAQERTGTIDLLTEANIRVHGAAAKDLAGLAVAGAGDANGDGRSDVLVGARLADNNDRTDSGSAYLVFGQASPTLLDLASLGGAGYRIDGAGANHSAGLAVAGAGDVNGDGRADVLVGAPGADNNNRTFSGSAYLVFGKTDTTRIDLANIGGAGYRIDGAAAGDLAGIGVAGAGDVNGDGRADVVVGAFTADNNNRTFSGSAYLVFGKADTAAIDLASLGGAGYRIDGAAADDFAGRSVAGAGDVNGDGRADVLVGAAEADNNDRADSGSAYLVFGKTDTAAVDLANIGSAGYRIDGATAGSRAGVVAGAGDVNGDGRADVLVGALFARNNNRGAPAQPTSSSARPTLPQSTSPASASPATGSTAPPRPTEPPGRSRARATSTATAARTWSSAPPSPTATIARTRAPPTSSSARPTRPRSTSPASASPATGSTARPRTTRPATRSRARATSTATAARTWSWAPPSPTTTTARTRAPRTSCSTRCRAPSPARRGR